MLHESDAPPKARTAVLLDGYPLWLDAVETVLAGIGVSVVGKTTSPQRALALLDEHSPDLLIADVEVIGDHVRIRWLESALRKRAGLKIIVLGHRADPRVVSEVIGAGAAAYMVKSAQTDDLALAVRQAFEHSIFLAPIQPTRLSDRSAAKVAANTLTRREWEILMLVSEGLSNAELARSLWVTEQTIKFHLSNVYRKLNVSNRTQASRWARINGMLDSGNDFLDSGKPAVGE